MKVHQEPAVGRDITDVAVVAIVARYSEENDSVILLTTWIVRVWKECPEGYLSWSSSRMRVASDA